MNFDAIAAAWAPRLLSMLRIMAGLLLLQHGTAKHLKFPAVSSMPTSRAELACRAIAGFIELVGGVLLVIGLFTRPAAFIAVGHDGGRLLHGPCAAGFFPILNGGELAVLYCFVFLYLAAAGPGPWSLDAHAQEVALNATSFGL